MSKSKNFFFRINSDKKIGFGHLARCLKIANALKKKCFFLVDKKSDNKFFNNINHNFISLYNTKKYQNQINDAKKINRVIGKFKNVYLIVDDYRIGVKWHTYFKEKNIKIIIIDDLLNRKFKCDMYLNFKLDNSVEFKKKIKSYVNDDSIKLIGPRYSIIEKKLVKKNNNFFNVMINFGNSSDFKTISNQIIKIHKFLEQKLPKLKMYLPIGDGAANFQKLMNYSKKFNNVKIIFKKFGISEYLNNVNLFIGSASTSIYEMSYLSTPSIFLICNKTQDYNISEIEKLGHYFLLNLKDFKQKKFLTFLDNYLDNYKEIKKLYSSRKVNIDNLGVNRVVDEIRKI